MRDEQMLLQPQLAAVTEDSQSLLNIKIKNKSFFGIEAYLTENTVCTIYEDHGERSKTYVRLHVNSLSLLSDFKQDASTNFSESPKRETSRTSIRRESLYYIPDGQTSIRGNS